MQREATALVHDALIEFPAPPARLWSLHEVLALGTQREPLWTGFALLEEVMGGVADERRLVIRDYFHEDTVWHLEEAMSALGALETDALLDLKTVAEMLHLPEGVNDLDAPLQPKGFRLLAKIPRLPDSITEHIVERFGNLPKIMRATIDDLDEVEGVGEARAKSIKEGLSRLAESSILDRYS